MSATASATSSCAGAQAPSTISASCRPAPASAIRSISNIWRRRCGPATSGRRRRSRLSRHAVGTDSHTTMVNGLGVLGWGVGGIEAEAAMLGQPISMLIPEVIGFRFTGKLKEGVTATDLVLTVTQMLRKNGRGRQVRRVLRRRPRRPAARGPRHDRQHGAGIRRDLRLLPGRRRDAQLPRRHRPQGSSASRWSRPTARRRACGATTTSADPVFTDTLALDLATSSRRSPGRSGRRTACRSTRAAGAFAEALDKEYGKADETRKARQGRGRPISISAMATW